MSASSTAMAYQMLVLGKALATRDAAGAFASRLADLAAQS
jgi:hypothetical protein